MVTRLYVAVCLPAWRRVPALVLMRLSAWLLSLAMRVSRGGLYISRGE